MDKWVINNTKTETRILWYLFKFAVKLLTVFASSPVKYKGEEYFHHLERCNLFGLICGKL